MEERSRATYQRSPSPPSSRLADQITILRRIRIILVMTLSVVSTRCMEIEVCLLFLSYLETRDT